MVWVDMGASTVQIQNILFKHLKALVFKPGRGSPRVRRIPRLRADRSSSISAGDARIDQRT
jgi:hypothetical protein